MLAPLALAACGAGDATGDAGMDASAADSAVIEGPDYLEQLDTVAEFESLAADGTVKYLARVDGREPLVDADCLFQNSRRFPFHAQFLRRVFPEYSDLSFDTYVEFVLRQATRRAWGGALEWRPRVTHPLSGQAGIYVYYAYQERQPDENLSVSQLVELDRRLKACAPIAASQLVFVPSVLEQEVHVRPLVPELNAAGVAVRFPADLIDRDYEAYSVGESYGYLHVIPAGTAVPEDYGSRDVLVVEGAPPDISTLAGLISTLPQSSLSHTNLRLRERGLPNVLLARAYTDSRVRDLEDRLVHVVATETELTLTSATLAEAEAYWEAHRPMVGPVSSDLNVTALEGMDTLTHEDAIAYGAKAANLGELHAVLPAQNRVEGFGIPFSAYRDFIVHNGLDANITALLADPQVGTDRAYRAEALDDLRKDIRNGAFQPGFFAALDARLREVFGADAATTFIRFRSSTNAEDLDAFSGAGLYDSKTGCLADDLDADTVGPSHCLSAEHRTFIEAELARRRAEQTAHPERWWVADIIADLEDDLTDEKTVADAVRKVWRSLWNLRAYDEREYYGIPHTDVFMGIAVQPTFVMERMESVAVTHLRPDAGDPLYRVVSQLGEVGIVRPIDPGAVPETLTFRRTPAAPNGMSDVRVAIPSSLSPGAQPLYDTAMQAQLGALLFTVHDHFAANVYPQLTGLRLDVEIEVTDGRIVLKQARPYLGVEP
ncbi:MAG: hypothetical protein H6726_03435 [Sandaracinaceae bacterium]|nr:hypothetical protein [Sandaracinaceae bacterium]